MGLDTVELVMELEDEFGVAIPDVVASRLISVGDTFQFITESLIGQEAVKGTCSTSRAFYALRRELVNRVGVPPGRVRLDTPLGELQPSLSGREWRKIADASGLRREPHQLFGLRTPPPQTPLRELIETRCKANWRRFDGTIDKDMVFQRIRQIVSDQLGVAIVEVKYETRYIEDLGAD
jgi:acyl carrier protein